MAANNQLFTDDDYIAMMRQFTENRDSYIKQYTGNKNYLEMSPGTLDKANSATLPSPATLTNAIQNLGSRTRVNQGEEHEMQPILGNQSPTLSNDSTDGNPQPQGYMGNPNYLSIPIPADGTDTTDGNVNNAVNNPGYFTPNSEQQTPNYVQAHIPPVKVPYANLSNNSSPAPSPRYMNISVEEVPPRPSPLDHQHNNVVKV